MTVFFEIERNKSRRDVLMVGGNVCLKKIRQLADDHVI